jgi:hypothetical protein
MDPITAKQARENATEVIESIESQYRIERERIYTDIELESEMGKFKYETKCNIEGAAFFTLIADLERLGYVVTVEAGQFIYIKW